MEFMTVALVAFSFVSCVGICAGAFYLTEIRKAEINQAGIDRRAQAKLQVNESVPQQKEWYLDLATELMKNPEIQRQLTPYIPSLLEKFGIKKG